MSIASFFNHLAGYEIFEASAKNQSNPMIRDFEVWIGLVVTKCAVFANEGQKLDLRKREKLKFCKLQISSVWCATQKNDFVDIVVQERLSWA